MNTQQKKPLRQAAMSNNANRPSRRARRARAGAPSAGGAARASAMRPAPQRLAPHPPIAHASPLTPAPEIASAFAPAGAARTDNSARDGLSERETCNVGGIEVMGAHSEAPELHARSTEDAEEYPTQPAAQDDNALVRAVTNDGAPGTSDTPVALELPVASVTEETMPDRARDISTWSAGFKRLAVIDGQSWLPAVGRAASTYARHGTHAWKKLIRRRFAQRRTPRYTRLVAAIAGALVLCLLVIAGVGVVNARNEYNQLRAVATDAMTHVHAIEALLASSRNATQTLNTGTLDQIRTQLVAAEHDFSILRVDLGAPSGTLGIAARLPGASNTIDSAGALASAADELSLAGLDLIAAAEPLVTTLHSGVLAKSSNGKTGIITPEMFANLSHNYDTALTHLENAVAFARRVNFSALPSSLVKPSDEQRITSLLAQWPAIHSTLLTVKGWLPLAPTLLGISKPEKLLFLMQDRSELRATGGFMGNYGVATISGAKLDPFSLRNTYLLDYPYLGSHGSYPLPPQYAWWPFSNFAMRDANLSGDFPTSARLIMKIYAAESGQSVQGVVAFTPVPVELALQMIGPVRVPGYPDVVTASNLENLIHIHQLADNQPFLERKAFTAALAQVVLGKIRAMSSSQLIKLMKTELTCLTTKDIQMYFADPQAEGLLQRYGVSGAIASPPGDAVSIIDANVGGNKASQFVTAEYKDNVTVNRDGSASHSLTITYDFHATDPAMVFGPLTLYDVVRIYTPKGSALTYLDGFYNDYTQSDLSWREMWGGPVVVQNNVPYTIHLSWKVPHAATRLKSGGWNYSIDFQHQAGSHQTLDLNVTLQGSKKPAIHYNGPLNQDLKFSVHY